MTKPGKYLFVGLGQDPWYFPGKWQHVSKRCWWASSQLLQTWWLLAPDGTAVYLLCSGASFYSWLLISNPCWHLKPMYITCLSSCCHSQAASCSITDICYDGYKTFLFSSTLSTFSVHVPFSQKKCSHFSLSQPPLLWILILLNVMIQCWINVSMLEYFGFGTLVSLYTVLYMFLTWLLNF